MGLMATWRLKIEDSRKTFLQIFMPWWLCGSVYPWAHPWPPHGLKIWRKVPMKSSIFNLQTARIKKKQKTKKNKLGAPTVWFMKMTKLHMHAVVTRDDTIVLASNVICIHFVQHAFKSERSKIHWFFGAPPPSEFVQPPLEREWSVFALVNLHDARFFKLHHLTIFNPHQRCG